MEMKESNFGIVSVVYALRPSDLGTGNQQRYQVMMSEAALYKCAFTLHYTAPIIN